MNLTRGGRSRWIAAALAVFALAAVAPSADAAAYQFANFNLVNANQPFSFTNNGGTSASIAVASAQVTFDFTAQSGLSTADHQGTLTVATTPGPSTFTPASTGFGFADQPITNTTTLSIIENGTGKNLLTLSFTGDIVGRLGGTDASLAGSDTTGQQVVYSSSFLTFAQPGNSYNLGLSTLSVPLSIGPGGFLNSFLSNLNGQFTANATNVNAVPVPPSVVMLGTGALAPIVMSFYRRRRQQQPQTV